MKKVALLFIAGLTSLSISFAGTQSTDTPHDGGFRLNFHVGSVNKAYGNTVDNGSDGPKTTLGVEIGTKWNLTTLSGDKMSIGLMADWFSLGYSGYKEKYSFLGQEESFGVTILNLSVLEVGPSFTYALSDDLALDAYYQIKPTFLVNIYDGEVETSEAVGINHVIGVAARYKMFNFGVEPIFGGITRKFEYFGYTEKIKINTASVRVVFGFKF